MSTFALDAPRYGVSSPTGRLFPSEVTYNEGAFFAAVCGYTLHEYRWDGKSFVSAANYMPGDF